MKLQPWQERYQTAHREFQQREYPSATNDFGHISTNFPDVTTGNGLNRFALMFLKYMGHRATRVNVAGRLVEKSTKTESGAVFMDKTWLSSSTRKGSADVSATINGRSCMFEGKAGKDKPRPEQLREQELERKAGGIYEFFNSAEQFLEIYDKIISNTL